MKHYVGLSEYEQIKFRKDIAIFYEPQTLINAHLLMCGMSGTGKSTQALGLLSSAVTAGIEVDVFDAHNEFDNVPGATACTFSQATGYGYNPLVLDTDLHTGGVNAQVDFFVRLIKNVTPQFGSKQEGVLRNLLTDTYAAHNITQGDTSSWQKSRVNETERLALVEKGDLQILHKCYPTLEDLKAIAKEKIIALTIGADNKCVTAIEALTRSHKKLDSLQKQQTRAVSDGEIEKIDNQIKNLGEKCKEAYGAFIDSFTGREIDDILRYDSADVLVSVFQRIVLLGVTGILSANEPPFGNSRVRVHQIKSISNDQQILYVKLRLQDLFDGCKRQGQIPPGTAPRNIAFLDEGHKYFSNDPADIINVISKEGRKFGLALWCASQEPTSFPASFLTSVGATVMLGIHTSYWKKAASMFRISEESLKTIKPKEVMAVKFLRDGCVDPPFSNVVVPNPNSDRGRQAVAARP